MTEVAFQKTEPNNILMSSRAFLTLKDNLEKNIGSHKTKGFLFRFGKEFGIEAAKSKLPRKRKVGKMHPRLGHVREVIFEGEIIRHPNGEIECRNTHGKWIDSFEAALYLKNGKLATEPVCHTLCGFASGALSYEFDVSMIAIETKCVAKGDPHCEFEIRLEKDWLPEKEELITLYQNDNILSELEMTYDALLQHKQFLEKLSVFQTQLTQNVTDKYSLDELIDEAYQLLQIPIVVEDRHGHQWKQSGLTEEQQQHIQNNPPTLIEHKKDMNAAHYQGSGYIKLSSPILINKKNYGTCSFIYFSPNNMSDNDYLFLEKVANVVALSILYEEAQFDEQQRLRNSIIERLIHTRNLKSIESSFKFLSFPFQPPFSTAVLHIKKVKEDPSSIDYHEQLIQLSELFEQWNVPSVFAEIGDEIVLLHSHMNELHDSTRVWEKLFEKLAQDNPMFSYSIGMSRTFTDLQYFQQSLKEARVAQRFPNHKMLTNYDDLGMLGDIVTSMSVEQIHESAKKTLKGLYDFDNHRNKELLHTLYIYLLKGQHLKDTMDYLHLSIGGIQYRIKKIEELLQISLKDASMSAYILLMIQALILIGELDFDEMKQMP